MVLFSNVYSCNSMWLINVFKFACSVEYPLWHTIPGSIEHDDVIIWKYFPRYWPFVRGIHRPVTGEFPPQRPLRRSFDVFLYLRLNKQLINKSWGWWFETPSCSLWRHCNGAQWPRCSNAGCNNLTLQQRYGHYGIPNHRKFDYLFKTLLVLIKRKILKHCVSHHLWGKSNGALGYFNKGIRCDVMSSSSSYCQFKSVS